MQQRRHSQRGFTLIEMMVVVIIIAILSAIVISVKSGTYGVNTQNTAQSVANLFNSCKMRAVSTKRWHRCELTATTFTMEQWYTTGMTTPNPASCSPPNPTNCYLLISQTTFDKNLFISAASTTIYNNGGAASGVTAAGTGLPFDMDFKPDGSSTGGTAFITDTQGNKPWRTVVYRATGGSYARAGW